MCGRYLILSSPQAFRRLFGYREEPDFPPRYNVAPTQPVPIVRLAERERQFALVRWGLIPPWVKDPRTFTLLVNARAETKVKKEFARERCVFPRDLLAIGRGAQRIAHALEHALQRAVRRINVLE